MKFRYIYPNKVDIGDTRTNAGLPNKLPDGTQIIII